MAIFQKLISLFFAFIFSIFGNNVTTKYGVIITKESDGTQSYNRAGYNATYDELLPAAKTNRSNYSSTINEVLRLTNKMRSEKGLSALTLDSKLTEQACVRAEEVAWSGKHSHTRPDLSSWKTMFTDNGYTTGTAGENLAWGYNNAADACAAWKASSGHYENIIDSRFTKIGIGVAQDPETGYLVMVQHFYG